MIKNPLVSIVMPCFNAAATIQQSVRSIQTQIYTNWELLILVDGSTDNTTTIAQSLAISEPRIRLVVSANNRGVIRMRNLGIRLAKGEWIAYCDSDDWWIPEKLQLQLCMAEEKSANLLYSAVYYVREGSRVRQKIVRLLPDARYFDMLKTNAIPMSSAMFSCKSLGKHYFSQMPDKFIHEDYAYWLQLFKKGSVVASYLKTPTTYIRFRQNSRSSNLLKAGRSQIFILRNVGNLPYVLIFCRFLYYSVIATKKRIPWFGWKTIR